MWRWAVQLLANAFDVFPFLYIPGFYKIQFTAEPLLLCHCHWFSQGRDLICKLCQQRAAGADVVRGDFRAPIPGQKFPVSTRSIPSLQSWSHGAAQSVLVPCPGCLVGRIPGICCFHASPAINSTVVLKSFFLSLWTYDVSGGNWFFSLLSKQKPQGCSIFCYIYIIYKYIYRNKTFFLTCSCRNIPLLPSPLQSLGEFCVTFLRQFSLFSILWEFLSVKLFLSSGLGWLHGLQESSWLLLWRKEIFLRKKRLFHIQINGSVFKLGFCTFSLNSVFSFVFQQRFW